MFKPSWRASLLGGSTLHHDLCVSVRCGCTTLGLACWYTFIEDDEARASWMVISSIPMAAKFLRHTEIMYPTGNRSLYVLAGIDLSCHTTAAIMGGDYLGGVRACSKITGWGRKRPQVARIANRLRTILRLFTVRVEQQPFDFQLIRTILQMLVNSKPDNMLHWPPSSGHICRVCLGQVCDLLL
jgi:hypothetical protein